jgi:hypothetical protein
VGGKVANKPNTWLDFIEIRRTLDRIGERLFGVASWAVFPDSKDSASLHKFTPTRVLWRDPVERIGLLR